MAKHVMSLTYKPKIEAVKNGTCWVNLGDSYGSGRGEPGSIGSKRPDEWYARRALPNASKCLLQIPSRFAIAMADHGWILRNEIIWHKQNCMPTSAEDRFTIDFEKMFFFVKSKKYYFEPQREPYSRGYLERARTDIPDLTNFGGVAP